MFDLYDTISHRPGEPPPFEEIDIVILTSPSTIKGFLDIYGKSPRDKEIVAQGCNQKNSSNSFTSRPQIVYSSYIKGEIFTYHLPKLPYDFNALEPVISAEIMEFTTQSTMRAM